MDLIKAVEVYSKMVLIRLYVGDTENPLHICLDLLGDRDK